MKTQTFLIRCEYPDGDHIPTQEFVENIQEYFAANIMDGERGRLVVKPVYQPKEEGLVEEETKFGTASNPIEIKSNANCLTQERATEINKPKPKFKVGDKVILDPYPCVVTDVNWRDSLHGFIYTVRGIDFAKMVGEEDLVLDERIVPNTNEIIHLIKNAWNNFKDRYDIPDDYHFVDKNGNEINISEIVLEKVNTLKTQNDNMKHKELLLGLVSVANKGQELIPHKDYEIKQDGKKFYLVKKKKEYPKTYKECCEVLISKTDFQDFELVLTKLSTNRIEENSISIEPPHISLINAFYKLLICRDAYWKVAGEEMGLGKPWEPSDSDYITGRYCIFVHRGNILCDTPAQDCILTFPTEEMRDAFYENFKELIEQCKELL